MSLIIYDSLEINSRDKDIVATDYNVPVLGARTLYIAKSFLPNFQKKAFANPDYWKDGQIRWVKIVSDEEYATIQRRRYEKLAKTKGIMTPEEYELHNLRSQLLLQK